jgi:hypothetical protein
MQINIQINDESKLDFVLQLLREFSFVEIVSDKNGKTIQNGVAKPKKRTAEQQEIDEELLEDIKLYDKVKSRNETRVSLKEYRLERKLKAS